MKRLLFDTNILLDAFFRWREPAFEKEHKDAVALLDAVSQGKAIGLITPATMATVVHYLQRMETTIGTEQVARVVERLLEMMEWAPMLPEHFLGVLRSPIKDIEDAAQYLAAKSVGRLDGIVSRDRHFKGKVPQVYSAAQALRSIKK